MAEGEDLYDDLYEELGDTLFYKPPFQEIDAREEEFKKKEAELNGKVESLTKEVEALQQDKVVLTRNISCLFKTAQMELARKDKQMKELRDENSRLKLGGRRGPGPHSTNAAAKTNSAIVNSEQRLDGGVSNITHQLDTERTNAAVDNSKQRNASRPENSSTRTHERDAEGHRKSVDEGRKGTRSPSRGTKDRTADDSSNSYRSSSHINSGSERRHAEHGRRERSRDHSERRSRDHRDDGELRISDTRKRHRS